MDYDAIVQRTLAAICDGGRVEQTQKASMFGITQTRFRAWLGGRAFEATVMIYEEPDDRTGHSLSGIGLRIHSPAPVRMLLGDAKTGSLSLPRVLTGDPSFDADFRVFGVPEDVLRAVFDPQGCGELRASVLDLQNLWIEQGKGLLEHKVHFHVVDDQGSIDTSLEVVRAQIAFALRLADRISSASEHVRVQVRQGGGAGAEAAWLAQANVAVQAAAGRRDRNRMIIVLAVAGLVVVPIVVVLVAVVVLVLLSN